jgi:hypothetical protein
MPSLVSTWCFSWRFALADIKEQPRGKMIRCEGRRGLYCRIGKYSEKTYYARVHKKGKQTWRALGPDLDAAVTAHRLIKRGRVLRTTRNIPATKVYILPGEAIQLAARQGGRCAICDIETDKLNVDHCHRTGVIRGMLCGKCNTILGLAQDNIDILLSAINYLKSPPANIPGRQLKKINTLKRMRSKKHKGDKDLSSD